MSRVGVREGRSVSASITTSSSAPSLFLWKRSWPGLGIEFSDSSVRPLRYRCPATIVAAVKLVARAGGDVHLFERPATVLFGSAYLSDHHELGV